jgi:hypothetical protein
VPDCRRKHSLRNATLYACNAVTCSCARELRLSRVGLKGARRGGAGSSNPSRSFQSVSFGTSRGDPKTEGQSQNRRHRLTPEGAPGQGRQRRHGQGLRVEWASDEEGSARALQGLEGWPHSGRFSNASEPVSCAVRDPGLSLKKASRFESGPLVSDRPERVAASWIGRSMLILHAQLLLGSKPVGQVGAVSGTSGEKKFVGALADHLDAVLVYFGLLRAPPRQPSFAISRSGRRATRRTPDSSRS